MTEIPNTDNQTLINTLSCHRSPSQGKRFHVSRLQRGRDKSKKLHVRVLGLGLTHHHSDTAEEEETPWRPGSASLMGAMFGKNCRQITLKFRLTTNSFSPNHITSTNIDDWIFQNYLKGKSSWRSRLQTGSCKAAFISCESSTTVKQISILDIRMHLFLKVWFYLCFSSLECECEGTWSELWSWWLLMFLFFVES